MAGLLVLAGWEAFLRARWAVPEPEDGVRAWVENRRSLRGLGCDAVAIVGASRAQRIDTHSMADELTRPVVPLAIKGELPFAVIDDLASDDTFVGTLVVSLIPVNWWNAMPSERRAPRYVEAGSRGPLEVPSAAVVRTYLDTTWAFREPQFEPVHLWNEWREGRPVSPRAQREAYSERQIRRLGLSDYPFRPLDEAEWRRRADFLAERFGSIRDRGGRVVLLRMPVAHLRAAKEAERFPRATHWDRLASDLRARAGVVAIHFADHPELGRFDIRDGSHVTFADAPAFSRTLARVLRPHLREC